MKKKKKLKIDSLMTEGGLQTDNRMYYDPVYKSSMYGNFLHSLYTSKYKRGKIFFSFFLLILPTLIVDIVFTIQAFVHPVDIDYGNKIGTLFYLYPLSIFIYFVALKLIWKAIYDKKST